MGSDKSVQVLTLLKEISVLKELDSEYEAGPKTQVERRLVPPRSQNPSTLYPAPSSRKRRSLKKGYFTN